MSQNSDKPWAGRFNEPTDAFVEAFTASVGFDQRMYRQDIAGSIAHATMLAKVGVLTEQECKLITDGLHKIEKDIESVGEFIRLYTTRFKRWSSPKFLIGESYGTTRAAGLTGFLQGRHGMYLNGVMLVSSILNFQSARFDPGNDLPYILFLPTFMGHE